MTRSPRRWRRKVVLAGAFFALVGLPTVSVGSAPLGAAVAPASPNSWAAPTRVSGSALYSVSCVTERFCVAVGAGGSVFSYDGSRWRASASFPGTGRLWSVDCPTVRRCVAVGDHGMVTFFNGSRWSTPVDDDPGRVLSAVACWSPQDCFVGDSSAQVFALNGAQGSLPTSVDRYATFFTAYTSMSCVSGTRPMCALVDSSGSLLTWQRGSWSSVRLSSDPPVVSILAEDVIASVSCPTATECVALTDAGSIVTWNGRGWSAPQNFDPHGLVSGAVDCTSVSRCRILDDAGDAFTFEPGVPSFSGSLGKFTGPVPTGLSESLPVSMSCASVAFCVVVTGGGEASVLRSATHHD